MNGRHQGSAEAPAPAVATRSQSLTRMSLNLEHRNKKANDVHEGKREGILDEKVLNLPLWQSDHILMPWIYEGKFFSVKIEL